MRPILAGLETEYGFTVEGRGAEDQVDDAIGLVRSLPDEVFVGWDYRFESPRADLRGFRLSHLTADPQDAQFDRGRVRPNDQEVRSDRVLTNGARFYNDHGHPEYSTPECWTLDELLAHERAGDQVVLAAARAFESTIGRRVKVYKNNTDFHGSSYGTHESYLVPRVVGFDRLLAGLLPMLVGRTVLCGAGKVGREAGPPCAFQMSQRADFFAEVASAETLFRRPVFNTRDEPHGDPAKWIRMHVIAGDANMIASALRRKVGLMKIALWLTETGEAPLWRIPRPVEAAQAVSRAVDDEGRIELEGANWTTPRFVIESYLNAFERTVPPGNPTTDELHAIARECRELLDIRFTDPEGFARSVDWAAKRDLVRQYQEEEGFADGVPALASVDLAYHDLDPDEGLHHALAELGMVDPEPDPTEVDKRRTESLEGTRAAVRGHAVRHHREALIGVSWGCLTFNIDGRTHEVRLPPDARFPMYGLGEGTVEEFIAGVERAATDVGMES